jgi:hypothetical protein
MRIAATTCILYVLVLIGLCTSGAVVGMFGSRSLYLLSCVQMRDRFIPSRPVKVAPVSPPRSPHSSPCKEQSHAPLMPDDEVLPSKLGPFQTMYSLKYSPSKARAPLRDLLPIIYEVKMHDALRQLQRGGKSGIVMCSCGWSMTFGSVSSGVQIGHLISNRRCSRPNHR